MGTSPAARDTVREPERRFKVHRGDQQSAYFDMHRVHGWVRIRRSSLTGNRPNLIIFMSSTCKLINISFLIESSRPL